MIHTAGVLMASIENTSLIDRAGQPITIRTAQPNDAEALLTYIRSIAEGTEYFVIEPDEFPATVDEEQVYIQDHLDEPGKIILLAETDNRIIGNITFEAGIFRRTAHRGGLGIGVAEAYRGRGIGEALMQTLLDWATSITSIEKVTLDVFADNARAIGLYKKLGFVEEGRRIKDIKRGVEYVDTIMMYNFVK
jgi:RimJ/RimL family protein N-acetyltransferase